jgi:hypothetical protein
MSYPIVVFRSNGCKPTLAGLRHRQSQFENHGQNGCQSDLVVSPTPYQVHRFGQTLTKKLVAIKFNTISHDIIRSPCQLVGQGCMSDHAIRSGRFSVKKCLGCIVITSG